MILWAWAEELPAVLYTYSITVYVQASETFRFVYLQVWAALPILADLKNYNSLDNSTSRRRCTSTTHIILPYHQPDVLH